MHVWWFLGSIGCVLISIIYGQDIDPQLGDNDPANGEVQSIVLSIDTPSVENNHTHHHHDHAAGEQVASSEAKKTQKLEPFACYQCTNCNSKTDSVSHVCESGGNMCYTAHVRRVDNATNQVIRRGCISPKAQCALPDSHLSNSFHSITCCTTHQCNQATQLSSLFFLLLSTLGLFIVVVTVA